MRQKDAPSEMISIIIRISFPEGACAMMSVSQVEHCLKHILEERANVLARETGCIERQRKFSGADLLQTLVFGWLSHPDASLEATLIGGDAAGSRGDRYGGPQTLHSSVCPLPTCHSGGDDPCRGGGGSGSASGV